MKFSSNNHRKQPLQDSSPEQVWQWGETRWWPHRAKAIAELIPANASVLDLGSGFSKLNSLLDNAIYTPVDLHRWTPETKVVDLSKAKLPALGRHDYLIVQGLLEYLDNKPQFLKNITNFGDKLIITFMGDISDMLEATGWTVIKEQQFEPEQKVYYCEL